MTGQTRREFRYQIFLDPLFWQSPGKAIGGYEDKNRNCAPHPSSRTTRKMIEIEDNVGVMLTLKRMWLWSPPYKHGAKTWKEHWCRFRDHLAGGKDAESFFAELV
jgi:hypothetical protein